MPDDRGDVITSGLIKLVAALAVVSLIMFEVIAVAVNHVQLDDIANQALRAGAGASPRTEAHVERAVLAQLDAHEGVRLDDITVTAEELDITISRTAPTLVLDRLGPVGALAENSVQKELQFR